MTAIRGILLDKDGTILDFEASWAKLARRMALMAAGGDEERARFLLEQAGLDRKSGRFKPDSIFAAGTNADVVELWFPQLDRADLARKIDEFNAFSTSEGAASAVALPGAEQAVATLKQAGYRLGVATNDSTAGAEKSMHALGIASHFDATYGYDAVARPKPAADVVIAFADMTGLKPAQIAMVGDTRHDLEAGRAGHAGLVVGVLSGTGTRETLAPLADVVLDSLADLPAYLSAG